MIRELILIRHAHSEWQAGITRHKNSHLTSIGIKQASELSKTLAQYADISNFHILSSPLHRSVETARIALPIHLFAEVIFDHQFQEATFHVRSQLILPKKFYPDVRKKNSEKYLLFKENIKSSLGQILSNYDRIMIFTHSGVIKTVLRIHCGSDAFCTEIDNCSITHFIHKNNIWLVQRVNYVF